MASGIPSWEEQGTALRLFAAKAHSSRGGGGDTDDSGSRARKAERRGGGAAGAGAGAVPAAPVATPTGTASRGALMKAVLKHAQDTWAQRSASDERIVAPYSKANPRIIDFMLPKLGLTEGSVFFDLGCGDGRWLVPAAQRYKCRCVGLEVQKKAADDARRNAEEGGVAHLVSIKEDDFFKTDYSSATHAAVFLSKEGAARLATLLRTELRVGTPVVCLGFHLPGWVAEGNFREECKFPVFLYRAPGPMKPA